MMGGADGSDSGSWLMMLYLAGDNSLTEDMVLALQDLQAERAADGDKVVAQLDPSGEGLFTQRYDFSERKGGTLDSYRDPTFAGMASNTGSAEALADFVRWAHRRHRKPAKHLLILAGHGSGTTEDFFLKDETSRDSLTVPELARALATQGHRVARRTVAKYREMLGILASSKRKKLF